MPLTIRDGPLVPGGPLGFSRMDNTAGPALGSIRLPRAAGGCLPGMGDRGGEAPAPSACQIHVVVHAEGWMDVSVSNAGSAMDKVQAALL